MQAQKRRRDEGQRDGRRDAWEQRDAGFGDPDHQEAAYSMDGGAYGGAAADGQEGDADVPPDEAFDVVMACVHGGSMLGVAVYERLTNEVYVLQSLDDGKEPLPFQLLELAKLQTSPDVIYVSSKSEEVFVEACRKPVLNAGRPDSYNVRMEKGAAFAYDKAMHRLETLRVRNTTAAAAAAGGHQGRAQLHLLSTMIDLSREQQVMALGALLYVMHKEGPACGGSTSGDAASMSGDLHAGCLVVDNLSELNLHGCLMVDATTLAALQIFHEERHPSSMGIGKPKEGLSVFGTMNRCVTNMGRRLLRVWFLRPVVNLAVVNDRQDTVELLVNSPEDTQALRSVLKKIEDIPRIVARLQQSQARPDAKCFQALVDSLEHLAQLRDMF